MEKRVQFDFEIEFTNGGGLSGREFRLDLVGDEASDEEIAAAIVADLRLLMVGRVRVTNKQILVEPHKRAAVAAAPVTQAGRARKIVDLSHTIESGMVTYAGLPPPQISEFLSHVASRASYAAGTEFQIGRIEMVANTGTYLDSPFHRYAGATDIAGLELAAIADLDAVVVRVTGQSQRAITRELLVGALAGLEARGKAILVHTGWDAHWRTERYFAGHPHLTAEAAELLVERAVALVGIDSLNIDDTATGERPVHSALLGAGIPIVEHLCNLARLPLAGFRFSAIPAKVKGIGSFPVRAFATVIA